MKGKKPPIWARLGAAGLVVVAIIILILTHGHLQIYEAFVTALAPGNILLSWLLVRFGFPPWQGLVIELAILAAAFGIGSRKGGGRNIMRAVAGLFAIAAISAQIYFQKASLSKSDEGFAVARFSKESRNLVFIGEHHVSDIEYYMRMDAEIARLTADGYVFMYEDTDAYAVCNDLDGLDVVTYNIAPWHYFVEVVRSPLLWPSANSSSWHQVDLSRRDPSVRKIGTSTSGKACLSQIQAERDRNLVMSVDGSKESKIAVLYGAAHLGSTRNAFISAGWTLTDIITLPEGRESPLE